MPSQVSPRLEARGDLAELVRREDRILMPMLMEYSQSARALWDLSETRDVLTLFVTDPRGTAAGNFAPDELQNDGQFQRRVHQLIGEMVKPSRGDHRRVRIEFRDAFVPTSQLEQLRLRLGQIPDIAAARLRMNNQVRFLPQRPDNYLLTDFSIEVSEPFAAAVREAAQECGFMLREDPFLIRRDGVRDALLRFVDQQRGDVLPKPDFVLCFQLHDREIIHLLEVSQEVPEYEDGSLDAVGFSARGVVPFAQSLKIYLAHPNDLLTAFRVKPDHPLFFDLRNGNCEFLLPDDAGEAFRGRFPDLVRV